MGGNLECKSDGKEGLLVEVESTGAIVNAVRSIWSTPMHAREMAETALQRIMTQCSTSVMATEYESLYVELSEAGNRRYGAESQCHNRHLE
jgi:glycogen synthase